MTISNILTCCSSNYYLFQACAKTLEYARLCSFTANCLQEENVSIIATLYKKSTGLERLFKSDLSNSSLWGLLSHNEPPSKFLKFYSKSSCTLCFSQWGFLSVQSENLYQLSPMEAFNVLRFKKFRQFSMTGNLKFTQFTLRKFGNLTLTHQLIHLQLFFSGLKESY